MFFLITNDDGYKAAGIRALVEAVADIGACQVVAPERNRSGASNSLTLDAPLRVYEAEDGALYVNGTPTDCVHLAITGLLAQQPDMVISGINAGANLGDDVLYSGTVAAAMEGRFLGYPAIAISLASEECRHFDTAARVLTQLLQHLQRYPLPADSILNINVPDLDWERLRGFEVTRLGNRHKSEPVIIEKDPRGRPLYWVGPPGSEQDAGAGTDFHAIRHARVSVTPLQVDLTRFQALDDLRNWIQGLGRG